MSNQPKTVFLLEPVYDLSGQVIARELLTRLADDADINNKRNPERDVGFFSQLSADVKWQLFLHQIEKLIQLYQKGFDQIVSVNVDRDIVASIFKDAEIQEKLAQLTLLRLEISAFFTARFNSADLLILKGVAKVTPAPLWLDDFGPGYSNLSMFDSGIFEIVKIDKEFFWQFGDGRTFDILLDHLNELCNGVIVEGVENQQQVNLLAHKPIYGMQGYLWQSVYLDDLLA
ncbi:MULTISPECIES: EAL domain-containing protein [unclassified Enterobacter]|jgi:EAL domain-containing protein (putative c-di-GMP-specific phosphodiesterase class I)|uniref:EAL domain-containing protein n=1 Tax=unclassified Enterobacter TaxID=2608935 RepID=UPI0015C94BD4|nr:MULTISPECIES: EAL domain-containing protein [unclassified Enterobacter]MBB3306528.1 EAL domain-containing protein (putative c-di-GMP-specific phosphodiesterase class I) [Enterobacter sp. Sphag1F]NYI15343.1 EAL domain-containing protein (putative c-di-GMP-specific phosphodiesterase class I) [Enterobacter sp. Sphag71]